MEPRADHTDLAPIGAAIGDARIVGLGESIHTSEGFYRAKFRLFRYLVEARGFRAFAFESPWIAAEQTQRYVEWMCEFNRMFGANYVSIAATGYDVHYDWGRDKGVMRPRSSSAVENRLHSLREPYLFVDLRRRSRGAFIDPDQARELSQFKVQPGRHFHGILFLDESPPMRRVGVEQAD